MQRPKGFRLFPKTPAVDRNIHTFQSALAFHQQGNLLDAKKLYEVILKKNPNHFDALHLLGVLSYQQGDNEGAERFFLLAVRIKTDYAPLHSNYGLMLHKLKRYGEALHSYDKAIAIKSDFFEAFNNRGNTLKELRFFEEALVSFEKALDIKSDYADALNNRGLILQQLNRFNEALESYDKAISINSTYADAFNNRGNALRDLRRFDEALESYEKAISINQEHADAFNNRGNLYKEIKFFEGALASYEKAICLKPDLAHAFNNRGLMLQEIKRFEDALLSYDKAILLKSNSSEAFNNRGLVLQELKRFNEALQCFEKAISIKTDYANAVYNRGVTLIQLGQFDQAMANNRRLLEIECVELDSVASKAFDAFFSLDALPVSYSSEKEANTFFDQFNKKLNTLVCEEAMGKLKSEALKSLTQKIAFNMNGFYTAYFQKNAVDQLKLYSQVLTRALSIEHSSVFSKNRGSGKVRLGIASGLMKNHNGVNWAYNWVSNLPNDYDIFTYAFNSDSDALTVKFSQLGIHRSLRFDKKNFIDSINIMRADELDVLMLPDVGMTPSSRILSLHRIAPIQFTAWGHPITTGSENIDYFLSSDLMEPLDAQLHYTETLVRLPNLALYLTPPAPKEIEKLNFGLPKFHVLYGCLQSILKYHPQYDFIYPQIAKMIPEALFVFLEGEVAYATTILKQRLEAEFSLQGIDYEKHVRILPRVSAKAYLSLIDQMDIILDSIGWTGGNTSLEAISIGKPIVTVPGEFMRGRHTHGMFRMMGLQHHVSASIEEYINRAVELGKNLHKRAFAQEEIISNKDKLYEDKIFINALDKFLKSAVAKKIIKKIPEIAKLKHNLINIKIDIPNVGKRSFTHRGTKADKGVIQQIFKNQDYLLTRFSHHHDIEKRFRDIVAVGKKPLIVDAGANIGASVVWFAIKFPGSHIVAFEPDPENFSLLESNCIGLDVDLYNAAIGSEEGMVSVFDPGQGEWGYRTIISQTGSCRLMPLANTLREKFDAGYAPLIIKIDIEGGEDNLFKKNTGLMDEFPLLIIELHDWLLPNQGTSKNFIKWCAENTRDFLYYGENIFSVKK